MVSFITLLALPVLASAHFHLNYPFWRGDSLNTNDTSISQWNYPCAGIGQSMSSQNRTEWPLDGGAINFAGSHPWAFTYVNMGIGETVTSFNISLVEGFNQTGNGSFCWDKVPFTAAMAGVPVADGTPASIQVIQISHTGSSLYNCADIIFRSNATLLSGEMCRNATGVGAAKLTSVAATNSTGGSTGSTGSGSGTTGAAVPGREIMMSLLVGGLALAAAGSLL